MVDLSGCDSQHSWVCPNDRQLALRARLNTGWSMKTHKFQKYGYQPVVLSPSEREIICSVIKRAEEMDLVEQVRVGKLVERLNSMKKNVHGGRSNECILCGFKFGLCSSSQICNDCNKPVCKKCGVESYDKSQKESLWRCKICSESREMWKKSGAWFFKSIPKYILPPKKEVKSGKSCKFKTRPLKTGACDDNLIPEEQLNNHTTYIKFNKKSKDQSS